MKRARPAGKVRLMKTARLAISMVSTPAHGAVLALALLCRNRAAAMPAPRIRTDAGHAATRAELTAQAACWQVCASVEAWCHKNAEQCAGILSRQVSSILGRHGGRQSPATPASPVALAEVSRHAVLQNALTVSLNPGPASCSAHIRCDADQLRQVHAGCDSAYSMHAAACSPRNTSEADLG